MNTLKITKCNKAFIIELNTQKLYLFNHKALLYHLKYAAKFNQAQIANIVHILDTSSTIEMNLTKAS